ncbi:MAG: hypothetical protein Q3966_09745 [Neisseria sp.]|nr:hypothetical protein [Neisseria sp.]
MPLRYPVRLATGQTLDKVAVRRPRVGDMAWWFGRTAQAIDELPLDEFDGWLHEITRQVKAGYRKGG